MAIEFHKMHGAGNDFVLVDARHRPFGIDRALAGRIADRHRGIGCDQILVLREADDAASVLRYEIWNADGSPAAQCGNGARCVGLFLGRSGETGDEPFRLESPSGVVAIRRCRDGEYEVEMGRPEFEPSRVPLSLEPENGRYVLESPWGPLEFGAVSMGNPHALFLVEDIDRHDIPEIGRFLDAHGAFPEGCNAGFACVKAPGRILLRVIERGSGETLACGSGACAAVAVLRTWDRTEPEVDVHLPGGRLVIKWHGNGAPVVMKGPAEYVFRGTMNE
jgi:diaminopimelate epimerase